MRDEEFQSSARRELRNRRCMHCGGRMVPIAWKDSHKHLMCERCGHQHQVIVPAVASLMAERGTREADFFCEYYEQHGKAPPPGARPKQPKTQIVIANAAAISARKP